MENLFVCSAVGCRRTAFGLCFLHPKLIELHFRLENSPYLHRDRNLRFVAQMQRAMDEAYSNNRVLDSKNRAQAATMTETRTISVV